MNERILAFLESAVRELNNASYEAKEAGLTDFHNELESLWSDADTLLRKATEGGAR